jgi:multidrug efflux pump subunit AcrA (membrane-fusion protein)
MRPSYRWRIGIGVLLLVALGSGAYLTRSRWLPWCQSFLAHDAKTVAATADQDHGHDHEHEEDESLGESVILTDQAIVNLGIRSARVSPGAYWRTLVIPGQIVERPGHSDHRVTSPSDGIVSRISVHPGDTISPDDELFRIRLTSEAVHQAQADLYQKSQEREMVRAQRARLAAAGDAIAKERLIEIENQLARIELSLTARQRELLWRGFTEEQVAAVTRGEFVQELVVRAPRQESHPKHLKNGPLAEASHDSSDGNQRLGEVQELSVELGERVQAGQSLCLLAHHHALAIEGHAFADEAPLLQRAVRSGWPVRVDFLEAEAAGWSRPPDSFAIRHIGNTVDPTHRTISFWMPLENESQRVLANGRQILLWRFRPGQRVRIRVPIEKLESVHVLPAAAIVRDGIESYLFVQNVNRFHRFSVRVLTQDRDNVVVANDGTLLPGMYVVQEGAAKLNRALKSAASGAPPGYHVHADGSLHKNSDERE